MIRILFNATNETPSEKRLLDDLNITANCVMAFSIYKVVGEYQGSCIRVRRSSDNAEQDIGFVDGYIDVTSLETFCSGTNGFVSIWYNQVSFGNNAVQATTSIQPQIVSSGSFITDGISFVAASENILTVEVYTEINIVDPQLAFYINKLNHSVGYLFCKNTDDYSDMQYAYIDDGYYLKATQIFLQQTGPSLFSWSGVGTGETILKYGESSEQTNTFNDTLVNRDYFILGARKNFASFSYYATMNLKTMLIFNSDISNLYSQLSTSC